MLSFVKKYHFSRYIQILSLLTSIIECSKKSDPIAKFLYSNENICGDLFADSNWLPAQFNCRIKCNKLKEVCMYGININEKIFTCHTLPNICTEQLKSHLILNGYSLEELQLNEPQGPPITKKFNDIVPNTYTMPPSFEPHPPSMAPDDSIYGSTNSPFTNNQDFIVTSISSTTSIIDQAKNYEEDVTLKVDEPFVAQNNVYENQFLKPTLASYYRPKIVPTNFNYPTTEAPIQISNEVIDKYGITQPSMPSINIEPQMPSINNEPQMPSINNEPSMPSINIQSPIPSNNIQPSPTYISPTNNYNKKSEPTTFHISAPVFTYNLHNQENSAPSYGPIKQQSQYSEISNYNSKKRLQHVPTSKSKYGYYYDGYSYKKNTWKQGNQKLKKKVLYSDSGFFNGLRDLSTKCCAWALNGMCDGYWQRIRLICPKSCGTVICTTGEGKTGCNRAIDVNAYDCERQNHFYLGLQQNLLKEGLSRPLYNQYNNYESNAMGYQRNDYVNEKNNLYSDNAYSVENELIGWQRMFRQKKV